MLGIFSDYGVSISFGQWVKMGLPFVPVMSLIIAGYFLLVVRSKIKTQSINIAAEVKRESEKIGKMTADEYKAAAVLILVIVLWVTMSGKVGMGGPIILCLVLLITKPITSGGVRLSLCPRLIKNRVKPCSAIRFLEFLFCL